MTDLATLNDKINQQLPALIQQSTIANDELTLEIEAQHIHQACLVLRDHPDFNFKMLVDVCGVDYLHYGIGEWETESATLTGFERGVEKSALQHPHLTTRRFGVVYHLLSLELNHRVRLKVFLDTDHLKVASVMDIWPAANWYEREAFDLFGIEFEGHPDLRRLRTDYGFAGHPFRKDFPLIGHVEPRYDAHLGKVIYEPVSIKPRILEPKVIRKDNRYRVGD